MNFKNLITVSLASAISVCVFAQEMNDMWGGYAAPKSVSESKQLKLFEDGNYAMFIHWGLYSQLANKWRGKTYYGIGEWLMNENMAGIPVEDYMAVARDFNPVDFDAMAIARLAKDAGMKYIVVTSKHHDGFAMYDSQTCDFNIVDSTPFGRDPMKELSDACKELGLGFGFYYSHNQDWTYPGGNGGPRTDADGNDKTFDDYYAEKCRRQVNEITRNYGDIQLVWFDTPGGMPEKYARELVDIVHRNQPGALVSGRVGYGLGDYQTLGDMEVPLSNVDGLWESIDVTNDSWGYAWYDKNWKTPGQILRTLLSTVARGGTFMMNIGPDPTGKVPEPARKSLLSAGRWIARHPRAVYGAGASPWKHALAWGDATVSADTLNLLVYEWPASGKLYVPGVKSDIADVLLDNGDGGIALEYAKKGDWLEVQVPFKAPDELVSVVKVVARDKSGVRVDSIHAIDPEFGNNISVMFADVVGAKASKCQWMGKFGEWKTAYAVDSWGDGTSVTWTVDVFSPGYYSVDLCYAGDSRLVWNVSNDEGDAVQNQQDASHIYASHPIGWMKFERPGRHTVTVRLLDGDKSKASLTGISFAPVNL